MCIKTAAKLHKAKKHDLREKNKQKGTLPSAIIWAIFPGTRLGIILRQQLESMGAMGQPALCAIKRGQENVDLNKETKQE